ncbi:hypothetical protein [Rhodoferax sp.]|uniref:COG4648 family protein n=1 Tax=Rhodoferax sp. TaxID=50421 RepID=UPI002ACE9509|nr:hypothetical protein [Rhodoferax sp.]MDZ7918792.1 hypothetical protein [Rhodoferax sp.]
MRAVLLSVVTLLYPLMVYWGLGHAEPRWLALLLAGMAIARALTTRDKVWLMAAGGALLLSLVSLLGNQIWPLKLYPVLVSLLLLVVFATSLIQTPTAIERIARIREPDLDAAGVAYTRTVTKVWCAFFIINGSIALVTAVWASEAIWALYTGLISYGLMGVLFAAELLVRRRVRARHG